jgi:hypothetical protein
MLLMLLMMHFSPLSPSHNTIHAMYPAVTAARVSHCRPEIDPRVGTGDGSNISAVYLKMPSPHPVSIISNPDGQLAQQKGLVMILLCSVDYAKTVLCSMDCVKVLN